MIVYSFPDSPIDFKFPDKLSHLNLDLPMKHKKRYLRQIDEVKKIFNVVEQEFDTGYPIDKVLTKIFRRDKKYGSRDRRVISNSIFGYYRWFGWLRQLETKQTGLGLLLGYLLDENNVDDFIDFWIDDNGLDRETISKLTNHNDLSLKTKSDLLAHLIPDPDSRLLNPKQFPKRWDIDTIEWFQRRPNLWVRFVERISPTFLDFLENRKIEYRSTALSDLALEVLSPVNLNESSEYRQGKLEIQDIASQLVGKICQPQAGELWWDVCAGSGGKSLHLSTIMKGEGTVYATEVNSRYFKELLKRSNRNSIYRNIKALEWDGLASQHFTPVLNGVLIDAPCSGSGTWRRSPGLRWNTSDEMIRHYSNLQFEILSRVASQISKKTTIIYATCSIFPEENENVIERFLNMFDDFMVTDIDLPISASASGKGVYLIPPPVNGNGMFVSRLVRQ